MKRFFQYFGFNQIEQRGFIVLSSLILLVLFIPYIVKFFHKSDETNYSIVYFEDSDSNAESPNLELSKNIDFKGNNISKIKHNEITYFYFNPNNLDESSWMKLGFTAKQIKVIKNYEAKGGKFYKKEDLAKIYSISVADYKRVEPYIQIEGKRLSSYNPENEKIDKPSKEKASLVKNVTIVDINTADTSAFKLLNGIGSVFSKRIVKYRESLGGFYSVEQIAEVYGLPVETFDRVKSSLQISSAPPIQRININLADVDRLSKHPYINKKQAQTIVNYRNQHGNFNDLESLSQIKSLDNVFLHKIEHYLEY